MGEIEYSIFDIEVLKLIDSLSGSKCDLSLAETVYANLLNLSEDKRTQFFSIYALTAVSDNYVFRDIRKFLNKKGF